MLCKIADLLIEVPEAGMRSRLSEYLYNGEGAPDIVIQNERYRLHRYAASICMDSIAYMESGFQFSRKLLEFDGLFLHASAVELDGRAFLFSAPSGTGKSTHTRLWQQVFGSDAQVFNDDKPALRFLDDRWYAYGTPWCGKDGINQNKKVPLAGICFLKQGQENTIRRLNNWESIMRIVDQTMHRFKDPATFDLLLTHLDKLVRRIPVYELVNKPEPEAVRLSYETMRRGAEEAGL